MDSVTLASSSSVEETCCLCRRSVMEGSAIVKRKRFHGKTCESSKKLINDVLKENELSVLSFKETNDSNAYLCHQCHGQASKCVKLQGEIKKIKGNFLNFISKLTRLPVTVVPRKRSASVRDRCELSNSTVVQPESLGESGTTFLSDVKTIYNMSIDMPTSVSPRLVDPPAGASKDAVTTSPTVTVS